MTERVADLAGDPPPRRDARPDLSGPLSPAVFGQLFDDHAVPLYRYLARRVHEASADDLVAETFLVALQRRSSYDPQRAGVRPWLFGIATNLLRRHLRSEARLYRATARARSTAGGYSEGPEMTAAERVDAGARARQLARALAELKPGDRDVLLLTSWAELDSCEVAEALDIPVGTVR